MPTTAAAPAPQNVSLERTAAGAGTAAAIMAEVAALLERAARPPGTREGALIVAATELLQGRGELLDGMPEPELVQWTAVAAHVAAVAGALAAEGLEQLLARKTGEAEEPTGLVGPDGRPVSSSRVADLVALDGQPIGPPALSGRVRALAGMEDDRG